MVTSPSDLIKKYKQGKTITITKELLDAYPNNPTLKGKKVGQTLTMPSAPKVQVMPTNVATGG